MEVAIDQKTVLNELQKVVHKKKVRCMGPSCNEIEPFPKNFMTGDKE